MIDIKKRSAMARTGTWDIVEHRMDLPGIIYVNTDRTPAPENARMFLDAKEEKIAQLTFVDQGSIFTPNKEEGNVTIGPDFPHPMSLENLDIDVGTTGESFNAVVVHRGKEIPNEDGIEILVVGNAIELIRHPKEFIDEIVRLKSSTKGSCLIYLPGMATPSNIAFLTYCGIDIFDSTRVIWESRAGHVLTPDGRWPASHIDEESFNGILTHNYDALQKELRRTVHHIESGTLREFVEKRAVHDTWKYAS